MLYSELLEQPKILSSDTQVLHTISFTELQYILHSICVFIIVCVFFREGVLSY